MEIESENEADAAQIIIKEECNKWKKNLIMKEKKEKFYRWRMKSLRKLCGIMQ